MKLNKGGLKLCAAYIVFVILILTLAYLTSDPKGRVLLASLAWFPAGITFGILDVYPLMDQHPWTRFLGPPVSLLIMYLLGWLVNVIRFRHKVKETEALAHRLAEAKRSD
ncbi:hypothetical protein [Bradyrhizobium embrapense]|uniref:hypothetical protein n=1 Tax=Bradyrhizobium embrapense TaxID=630921 RepID=UPI00067C6EBB|nr:hypothetical protein [Bradyrhizobium embrapense]